MCGVLGYGGALSPGSRPRWDTLSAHATLPAGVAPVLAERVLSFFVSAEGVTDRRFFRACEERISDQSLLLSKQKTATPFRRLLPLRGLLIPGKSCDFDSRQIGTLTLSESLKNEFYAKFGVREKYPRPSINSKIFFGNFGGEIGVGGTLGRREIPIEIWS